MTWVAIKYTTSITIATGGVGTGAVITPADQSVPGTYAYYDKFIKSFERQFLDYGVNLDDSLSVAKNAINGYIQQVQQFGYRNDQQGERFFYGWSNVRVSDIEVSTNISGFSSYEPFNEHGPTLSYTLAFEDQSFTYYGMQEHFWMLANLGRNIWSLFPETFNYNTADVREYLSGQPLYDLQGGDDTAYLPDNLSAATTWNYTTVSGDIDPGGYGAIIVNGGGGSDRIYGGQFIDYIWGDEGNDTLFGAGSADHLQGGLGDDLLDGGDGDDYLNGNEGNDRIIGGNGRDLLFGLDGDDYFVGGAGGDNIYGGAGYDIVDYTSSPSGVTIDFNNFNLNNGDAFGDVIQEVEEIIGSNFSDVIKGSSYTPINDTFAGGSGDDYLDGGAGDDILKGDVGTDILHGGTGADVLDGGAGFDFASYSNAASGIVARLDFAAGLFGEALGDSYTFANGLLAIEGVIGSNFADTIIGDGAANGIYGGGGNDVILGLGGSDGIFGDFGNDTLFGGRGTDYLVGGNGAPVPAGQTDNDVFAFVSADTEAGVYDTIIDFHDGEDAILLQGFGYTSAARPVLIDVAYGPNIPATVISYGGGTAGVTVVGITSAQLQGAPAAGGDWVLY